MPRKKDITNQKFGRLLAIERVGFLKGYTHWKCVCECKNEVITRLDSLISGRAQSCGCLSKEITIANNKKRKIPENEAAINVIFGKYQYDAQNREYEFKLSLEEFISLITRNCFYCGSKPKNKTAGKYKFAHNGIDRKDNDLGYLFENCVPCCSECNRMKNELNDIDFINKIKQILITDYARKYACMPKRFFLRRVVDHSGVSGIGLVAFGIEWPSKKVTIEWIVGENISQENHETLENCMAIHGHGKHTVVEWIDNCDLKITE